MRNRLTAAIVAAIAMSLPAAASAHVTVSPDAAPADGYAMLDFAVPHGCDGAATTKVAIQMPPQVISATPEEVAGWTVRTKVGKLPEPAEQHGETVTEGVRQVTWTGGPLPDAHLQRFGLSVALTGEPGESVPFKVVQGCAGGAETAWIQVASADGPEPDHPAPAVTLTAAEDGHGHDAADSSGATPVAAVSNDDSGNGLAIAALIVGALGLVAGTTALLRSRRSMG